RILPVIDIFCVCLASRDLARENFASQRGGFPHILFIMVSTTFANLCIVLLLVNYATSSVLRGENDVQKQDMTKRDKRQDNKHDCLITLFESLQSCCAVPLLIPREPQQRCTMNNTDTKQGVFHTIRESVMKLWRTLTSTKKDEV
ncbi:hypothetical protein B566_EDAN012285, partial [Ephemera danica]